jgi:serine/threonine protein kinase
MAPEVIKTDPESATSATASYDSKADIWSIGITAIEIADKNPPLSDIHPMRALYLIPDSDLGLAKPKNWSKQFVDFIAQCLIKDPVKRPSASQLLQHPFMQKAKALNRQKIMQELVTKAKIAREKRKAGYDVDDDDEEEEKKEEVPAKVLAETMKQAKQAQAQVQAANAQAQAQAAAAAVAQQGSAQPQVQAPAVVQVLVTI